MKLKLFGGRGAPACQRVQLNGPEVTYASERLGFALYELLLTLA
jgi:hypothetical protein